MRHDDCSSGDLWGKWPTSELSFPSGHLGFHPFSCVHLVTKEGKWGGERWKVWLWRVPWPPCIKVLSAPWGANVFPSGCLLFVYQIYMLSFIWWLQGSLQCKSKQYNKQNNCPNPCNCLKGHRLFIYSKVWICFKPMSFTEAASSYCNPNYLQRLETFLLFVRVR